MFQLILTTPEGRRFDAAQRVTTLSWSGSIRQVSRQVRFGLVLPRDGSLPFVPCEVGTAVQLLVDGESRFMGSIVTRERGTGEDVAEFTALDRGFYLAGNEGWFVFSGQTPEKAVQTVCQGFGIPVGQLAPTGVAVSRKYPGVALSRIVDSLYTLAAEQNGKRYLARFNGDGALDVVEKPTAAALEIAPGKNLQTLRVSEDISHLQNSVAIYTDSGQLVRTVEEAESVARYGSLQRVVTQRKNGDAGAEAKGILEDNGPQQVLTAECLGNPLLVTGSAVILRDNAAGAAGLCWIDSDTHTWKNGQYFCRLTLNFKNKMNETTAGRESK